MKILYGGVQYDRFTPSRGHTFEHHNIYESLVAYPGVEVVYAPFERILEVGRKKFNEEILQKAKDEKFDLAFFFMYSTELDPHILAELKKYTTTVAWFADDSWRFYNYSKFWAKHFTWAITTYSHMPELYRAAGQPNVIRSQWAANTKEYFPHKQNVVKEIPDVSFIGLWSPAREKMVKRLEAQGISVTLFGRGWPTGRSAKEEEMLELFSLSRINLGLNPPPGRFNFNGIGRLLFEPSLGSSGNVRPNLHLYSNFVSWLHMNVPQVKARHFQIPACGGLVITGPADDLDKYYVPDKEIVLYKDEAELAEKIRYYLDHEAEQQAIARAGYERTIREHTYQKRFEEIFKTIGLIKS